MAEAKYGRLFTQEEVEELLEDAVTAASGMGVGEGDVTRMREALNGAKGERLAGGRFPEDEPLFLLRGQDLYAPVAIRAYAEHLLEQGDVGMAGEVDEQLQRVRSWQRANRGRVGLPD